MAQSRMGFAGAAMAAVVVVVAATPSGGRGFAVRQLRALCERAFS